MVIISSCSLQDNELLHMGAFKNEKCSQNYAKANVEALD